VIDTIYIEEEIRDHPRTRIICDQFSRARRIHCGHYGEIFNRKAQNPRLQKRKPALILAVKKGKKVHAVPAGYGIGHAHNYYFSHMLNCLYDCRYCFLQGMFNSAHYVLFVNHEEFQEAILTLEQKHGESCCFFSGYDCDSLAMDSTTRFTESFMPFFREGLRHSWLELRTKSVNVKPVLDQEPFERCVVAFSMTPMEFSRALEHGVPPLKSRLKIMSRLQDAGWNVGVRIDPLLYHSSFKIIYDRFFKQLFLHLDPGQLHSVSIGSFRVPVGMFRKMEKLHPDTPLFAGPLEKRSSMVRYADDLERELLEHCESRIKDHVPSGRFFPCRNLVPDQAAG